MKQIIVPIFLLILCSCTQSQENKIPPPTQAKQNIEVPTSTNQTNKRTSTRSKTLPGFTNLELVYPAKFKELDLPQLKGLELDQVSKKQSPNYDHYELKGNSTKTPDEIYNFYAQKLVQQGWGKTTDTGSEAGTMRAISFSKDKDIFNISLNKRSDTKNSVTFVLIDML